MVATFSVAIATILITLSLRRTADNSLRISFDLLQLRTVMVPLEGIQEEMDAIEETRSDRKALDPEHIATLDELDRQAGHVLDLLDWN
jgi:hydrogenase-4 membrane subunit HyfE